MEKLTFLRFLWKYSSKQRNKKTETHFANEPMIPKSNDNFLELHQFMRESLFPKNKMVSL